MMLKRACSSEIICRIFLGDEQFDTEFDGLDGTTVDNALAVTRVTEFFHDVRTKEEDC